MTLLDRIEEFGSAIVLGIAGLIVSGFGWLVRHVLTSKTQIDMLAREIQYRDTLRKEDREAMKEVRDDVKALRDDVGRLLGRTE